MDDAGRFPLRVGWSCTGGHRQSNAEAVYVEISHWDVSGVTNMSGLLQEAPDTCNPQIGDWNTAAVTDMSLMFAISRFDQDIDTGTRPR